MNTENIISSYVKEAINSGKINKHNYTDYRTASLNVTELQSIDSLKEIPRITIYIKYKNIVNDYFNKTISSDEEQTDEDNSSSEDDSSDEEQTDFNDSSDEEQTDEKLEQIDEQALKDAIKLSIHNGEIDEHNYNDILTIDSCIIKVIEPFNDVNISNEYIIRLYNSVCDLYFYNYKDILTNSCRPDYCYEFTRNSINLEIRDYMDNNFINKDNYYLLGIKQYVKREIYKNKFINYTEADINKWYDECVCDRFVNLNKYGIPPYLFIELKRYIERLAKHNIAIIKSDIFKYQTINRFDIMGNTFDKIINDIINEHSIAEVNEQVNNVNNVNEHVNNVNEVNEVNEHSTAEVNDVINEQVTNYSLAQRISMFLIMLGLTINNLLKSLTDKAKEQIPIIISHCKTSIYQLYHTIANFVNNHPFMTNSFINMIFTILLCLFMYYKLTNI